MLQHPSDSGTQFRGSRDSHFNYENIMSQYLTTDKQNDVLNCDFRFDACGWTQESDSTLNWQYSYADKAILFSHKSGSHAPSLYSPNIDQSLFGFCFTFDYRLENVALDIQMQFKETNTIHTLDTLDSQTSGHQVVEINVLSEVGKILITPRVSNTVQNSVQLSNFSMKRVGYCGYSQVYNTRRITETSGEVIVLKSNEIKECKWVNFNGTFTKLPDIYLETKYENIRATIDHRSTTGFEICAFATTYMPYLSVRISWKASENVIMVCDTVEYRCQSGECIKRESICDAYRDCLSGDDETSEVCANAMSQLAFATFSTTVMLTYLVTYMKYIKDIRIMILGDRLNEENRLEEINLREIQREENE